MIGPKSGGDVRIFDAQLRSETRGEADLKNLAYFGTTFVVSTLNCLPAQTAEEVLARAATFVREEPSRLRRAGLACVLGLGVLPAARPKRAHPELWSGLESLLTQPEVRVVGEIAAWEDTESHWEPFFRQVKMAVEVGLPIVVSPPQELRVTMTYKMLMRLERAGVDPSRVLINHVDARIVEAVLADGFWGSVTVGPRHCSPDVAAEVIAGAMGPAVRLMLNTSLSDGPVDVLSLPKTAEKLSERALEPALLERVVYGNAAEFYRVHQSEESARPETQP